MLNCCFSFVRRIILRDCDATCFIVFLVHLFKCVSVAVAEQVFSFCIARRSRNAHSLYVISFKTLRCRYCLKTPAREENTKELQASICRQMLSFAHHSKEEGQRSLSDKTPETLQQEEMSMLVLLPEITSVLRGLRDPTMKTFVRTFCACFDKADHAQWMAGTDQNSLGRGDSGIWWQCLWSLHFTKPA